MQQLKDVLQREALAKEQVDQLANGHLHERQDGVDYLDFVHLADFRVHDLIDLELEVFDVDLDPHVGYGDLSSEDDVLGPDSKDLGEVLVFLLLLTLNVKAEFRLDVHALFLSGVELRHVPDRLDVHSARHSQVPAVLMKTVSDEDSAQFSSRDRQVRADQGNIRRVNGFEN